MSEMDQKDVFVTSEGDRYYERNKERLLLVDEKAAKDQIIKSLRALRLRPASVLEIGCSNGWRLEGLRQMFEARCFGLEPSSQAVRDGRVRFPHIFLQRGTADRLPFGDASFELVIMGFCLYLCDRRDLFRIACETDRVLKEKGYIALLDFHPPFPYQNNYGHRTGVFVYKMDYTRLFTWNPAYGLISLLVFNQDDGSGQISDPNARGAVAVLQKDSQIAYPDNPWTSRKT